MSTRRVLQFTDTDGFGGAEQALLMLCAGLDVDRWQTSLAYHPSPGSRPLAQAAARTGIRLVPVAEMPPGLAHARRAVAFARALRRSRVDVFHAHLTWQLGAKFALAAAVLARVPCIVATVQLFEPVDVDRSTATQQWVLGRAVDRYVAVSQHVADAVVDQLHWPRASVRIVHNAVQLERFAARDDAALRATLLIPGTDVLAVVPARLVPQKGHRHLLAAAAELPQVTFALAGDGPDRLSLEQQARASGLADRVLFLGARSDMPDLMAAADLVVLPSLWEGLPLSALEAMSTGKPLVATDIGGTSEAVVDGQTGLLVAPGDAAALRDAVAALLADREAAEAMGRRARAHVVERFSAERMVREVTAIYDDVLGAGA